MRSALERLVRLSSHALKQPICVMIESTLEGSAQNPAHPMLGQPSRASGSFSGWACFPRENQTNLWHHVLHCPSIEIQCHLMLECETPDIALLQDFRDSVQDVFLCHHASLKLGLLEQQVQHQQDQLQQILQGTKTVVWTVDMATGQLQVQDGSSSARRTYPQSLQEFQSHVHPEDLPGLVLAWQKALQGQDSDVPFRLNWPDQQGRWFISRLRVQKNAEGTPVQLLGVTQDITEQHQAASKLQDSESRLRAVIEHSQDAIFIKDLAGHYLLVNRAACEMMERSPEQILCRTDHALLPEEEALRVQKVDQTVLETCVPITYEYPLVYGDLQRTVQTTKYPYLQNGEVKGVVGVTRDITDLKHLEMQLRLHNQSLQDAVQVRTREVEVLSEALQRQAIHDSLTSLANRHLLEERLEQAMRRMTRDVDQTHAVLCVDCDQFKRINDAYGHSVGDHFLKVFAARLSTAVRPYDTVARFGGDEFAILLEDLQDQQQALQLALSIQHLLHEPYDLNGLYLHATSSIGLVMGNAIYTHPEEILRDADTAMSHAKEAGIGQLRLFESGMREKVLRRSWLEQELRLALQKGCIHPHFQPIVHSRTGQISGFEALARWNHPEHGFIPPTEFIPVAEHAGLITELDRQILQKACEQISQWAHLHPQMAQLHLSVNVSSAQFSRPDFSEVLERTLNQSLHPAVQLHLELTERLLLERSPEVNRHLGKLKDLGVKFHIDDFGTGYSSLSYLPQFAASALKIDRSFVRDLMHDPHQREVVKTIIHLAHNLGLEVVAEGVETPEQQAWLIEAGCDYLQGYLFSPPVASQQARALLNPF